MLSTLTDASIMSRQPLASGWHVRSLLEAVAAVRPFAHALIDCGALVTGMDNLEVATFLLPRLPAHVDGVCYLEVLFFLIESPSPLFPICGDPISPTCQKSNAFFESNPQHPFSLYVATPLLPRVRNQMLFLSQIPSTPFPHMWRPHFSHMSEIKCFF